MTLPASAATAASFSVAFWVKPDQLRVQGLMDKAEAGNWTATWRLFMRDSSGHLEFDSKADANNLITSGTNVLRAGYWSHVVVTYDAPATTGRIYLDGYQVAQSTSLADMGGAYNAAITLGSTEGARLDGTLDEVAIFTGALTATQAQGLYQARQSTYAQSVLADGPLAYWRLGETSGTVAVNATGHGYVGTYTGTVTVGQAGTLTGDGNTAALFDGSNGYLGMPHTAPLQATIAMTAKVQMKKTVDRAYEWLVAKTGYPNQEWALLTNASGGIFFDMQAGVPKYVDV